jgi:TRAP-type C4-dicarboxylate transport system substrate-binding protein
MKSISRRTTLKGIAAAGLAGVGAGLLPRGARAAETTWELYTYYPVATGTTGRGMAKIAEDLDKATNGQFKIKVHLGGSLPIQAASITPAVANNVVQIAGDIFAVGNVPILGVLRLPMLVRNVEEFEAANKVALPYIEAAYDKKGITVLGRYVYPEQSIWSRKKLTSVADLSGQKIRVTSPEQGELIKRFGGTALTMGTPDVAAALDRGVVEGVVTAASGGGYIWRDLLKYNYQFPVNFLETLMIANKEALAKLPADQLAALRKVVTDSTAWITSTLTSEESELRDKMKAAGLVVTAATPAEINEGQKKMTEYWDEWAKTQTPETADALAKVRKALGR